jgi:hypothetical protein
VCVILGREEKGWLKFLGIVVTIIGATIHCFCFTHHVSACDCPHHSCATGAVVLLEVESFELSHDTMMGNFLVIVTTVRFLSGIDACLIRFPSAVLTPCCDAWAAGTVHHLHCDGQASL